VTRALAITIALLLTAPAYADEISGRVRVIDGDTIVVNGAHVRLNGVDAPEVAHPYHEYDDPFGPESREETRAIIGSQEVRCELSGEKSYERFVGICALPDGTDIGAEIIRRGLALDCARFSHGRYRQLEPEGVRDIITPAPYC
jgi:micrococcal nuclease